MLKGSEILFRLILSVVLSGIIGLERELSKKEAGLRTHMLVCIGSTLIMLTSIYVFDIYRDIATVDPSRIAASVITGIGFLGAGTILRFGHDVRGLTTAACLWVTAAVGLAVGCGFYFASILTSLFTLVILLFFARLEQKIK